MFRCDRCGKGVLVGMNVSHSHIRTKKRSYPNLHAFKMKVNGVTRRLRLCTKCLRIVKKEAAVSVKTKNIAVPDNASGVSRGGRATPATLPASRQGTENTEKKTEDTEEKSAATEDADQPTKQRKVSA